MISFLFAVKRKSETFEVMKVAFRLWQHEYHAYAVNILYILDISAIWICTHGTHDVCSKIFEWFTLGSPCFLFSAQNASVFLDASILPQLSLFIQNKGYIPKENSTWKTQRQRINFFLRFFVLMWCCIHLSAHLGKCTHTENYKPAKAIFMRTTFELEKHQLSWCTNNDFFDLLAFSLSLSLFSRSLNAFLFHSFVAPYHEKTVQSRTISNCTSHSRYNNNGSKIKKNVICYVMPRGFAVNDFLFSGSFRCWCSDIYIYTSLTFYVELSFTDGSFAHVLSIFFKYTCIKVLFAINDSQQQQIQHQVYALHVNNVIKTMKSLYTICKPLFFVLLFLLCSHCHIATFSRITRFPSVFSQCVCFFSRSIQKPKIEYTMS